MWEGRDRRSFNVSEDKYQRCVGCEKELVVLPNDRRRGYCFDCLSMLDHGADFCPRCRSPLTSDLGVIQCASCGLSLHS